MCIRPRALSFDLDSESSNFLETDASVANPFDVEPIEADTEDEDDLVYDRTPENVCLDETVKMQMDAAASLMVAFAFSPHVPQPLRQLASVASELMGELGPLQEHGLVCVHKSCVCDFHRMYEELAASFPGYLPTQRHSLDVIIEAIYKVMLLGYRFLPEETQRAYIRSALASLESMMGEWKFDYGLDGHVCVPLYTRGNVDPDGEPNVYS